MNVFDLVNSINNKKKVDWSEDVEKEYKPFLVNRNFAKTADTVLFAAEMDLVSHLDKKLQYDFYYFGIPKGKRFEKGIEKEKKSEKETLVMELTGVNWSVARDYVKVLDASTPGWEKTEKDRLEKGGKKR